MASAAENRRGIIFMLVAMSLFVINDVFMKLSREVYPAGQAIALRTGFAVVVGFALVLAAREGRHLRMAFRPRVLQRGMLEAVNALTFGWSLGLMPLANLTAINMASPLLIVALAVLLRIETVGWRRAVALAVGFVGVLFVVRPGAESFNAAAIVAVFSTFLVAARDLTTRTIGEDVPSTVVSLTTTVLVGLVAVAYGFTETWLPVWRVETVYVALAAVLVTVGTFFIISAFRRTDVGVISQYRYAIIVFATVLGYVVWGDVPDLFAAIGVALIVGSGLYTMHRQRVRPDSNLKLTREAGSMMTAAIKPTLAILVAISALQPIALNLLAPATPALARHFASNYATIQLTLTLFLVAVAVTQLIIGPLSDRFGRRPCVNAGAALFVLGSVLGALAPTTHVLLIARVLEGAGGGAVFALSRAIIRDTADRDHAASQIATVTMVMVVAPMIAPWLGGQIETALGWRAIFWFMTLFGAVVLAFTLARLPETAPNLGRQSSLLGVFRVFPELVRNREFMLNVVAGSSASSAFFVFIAATPYIVVETMGRGSDVYGTYFILNALGYMAGNFAMSRLAVRVGTQTMVRRGLVISFVGTAVAMALSFTPWWSPLALFLPLAVNAIGNGMTIPGATAEALSARPELAGSAAGLLGATQLGFSAALTVLISWLVTIWPQSMNLLIWLLTTAGLAAVWFVRPRPGR